jgi:hypothetical protein
MLVLDGAPPQAFTVGEDKIPVVEKSAVDF